MKIQKAEILVLSIPLKQVVHHSLASRRTARNVFVVLYDETGVRGWGECCPRPYVTGETVESAVNDIRSLFLPPLIGREFSTLEEICEYLSRASADLPKNKQAAFCAVELAALDLAGKYFQCSAGIPVGEIQRDWVMYSGVIAAESLPTFQKQAFFLSKMKVYSVKVKASKSLETNRAFFETARSVLGSDVELRLDANGAWTGAEAIYQLEQLKNFCIAGVEQPVPAEDLAGLKQVTASNLAPVIVDESLCSVKDAETLIREKACHIFNLRVSKCGGLLNTRRIYEKAIQAGLSCQLGAQVGETGFLSAAGRLLATRLPDLRWFEGSYGSLLLECDITIPDITVGVRGEACVLQGDGLGVDPDWDAVERFLESRVSWDE